MGSIEKAPTSIIRSKLNLEEKISLLAATDWWRTPAIKRDDVFVPHIKTTDGPNGARGESYVSGIRAACFPCSTSMGATFDVDILYETGRQIAKEAITKSANVLLAPTVNVIRSPLGGRNYETYSEDPMVLGVLGAAYVNGCQSIGIAATPKHFVANEAENRRKFLSAEIDEQTLREIYLRPFQLIMKLSNPWCFMTSYNRVNGKYVADDRRLIDDVLRKEWGFSGLVMSDWMGTYSTEDGINAGVDLEMPGPTLFRGEKLLKAVKDHLVSETTIDTSAQRILDLAEQLGRFEAPEEAQEIELENPERDDFICTAAAEGMVLLKNTNQTLPIAPGSTMAVIGHLARTVSLGGGGSAKVNALHAVTPLQGLDSLGVNYTFEPGVPVFGAVPHADSTILSQTGINDPPGTIERPVKLEWFNGLVVGDNLVHEEMLPFAEYMIKEAWPTYLEENYCTRMSFDITPATSGNHSLSIITTGTATVYIDGEKFYDRKQEPKLVMESFYFFKSKIERRFTHPMEAGRRYTIRVESWRTEPEALARVKGVVFQGSALRFFEYIDIPAAIASAAETARKSDYAVVFVGNTNEIESEGYDRETMDLPGEQYELIQAVAARNSKTIVVNFSGGPVTMTSFVDSVSAVLQAWFPGQECGHSVAQILMGHINPGGRLPFSWPKKLEDNPSYHNFPVDENDLLRYEEGLDVGYRYYDRKNTPEPLFPFGFGLSYTTFQLSEIKATRPKMINGRVEVSCLARNVGDRSGKLVVQFYVEMPTVIPGLLRPLKELKSFAKVSLKSHESKSVVIELDKYSISFYDIDMKCWRAQKGDYVVHVGTSTNDIAGSVRFSVSEGFTWIGV